MRLTGPVPIANEEYSTVQDGAIVNGIGTVLIVLVILWMALHSAKIIFAVFANLFIGLVDHDRGRLDDGGVAEPAVDRLCRAVRRPRRRFRHSVQRPLPLRAFQERGSGAGAGERGAKSAVPLSLAAMATAAGFLCFLPTDYKGISELGKIAGAGMLIAFLSSITVLPAMLKLLQSARRKRAGRIRLPGAGGPTSWKGHRYWIVGGTLLVGGRRPAAAVFPEVRLQSDEPAQSEGRVDRDLPRPAQGSQHRRQRHQRDDHFGSGREEDRGQAGKAAGSAAREVARQLRARGSAGQAETDREGGQGAGARAQSGVGRRAADRSRKMSRR